MSIISELKPASAKAFARFLYAHVPCAARLRFTAKDLAARYVSKPEFRGVSYLPIDSGLIIDVGANRGQSIAAFRRLRPQCNIVAFEPEPHAAARLIERFSGDESVIVKDCALGIETGLLSFFVPRYGRWNCDGMAATSRHEATQWLRDRGRMYRFDEAMLTVEEHIVPSRTLDSFQLSPVLLKLHAQTAELSILRGSQETLRKCAPAIMCAFPTPELADFVQSFDYHPYNYSAGRFASGYADISRTFTWFLKSDHLRHLQSFARQICKRTAEHHERAASDRTQHRSTGNMTCPNAVMPSAD